MAHAQVLTLDDIRVQAPSVFANAPASNVSTRYSFIPTAQVVETMMGEGWVPTSAMQSTARLDARRGYQKHLIRFRRSEDVDRTAVVGEEVAEIILSNAHDGSASYELSAGLYRFVCGNGLAVPSSVVGAIKVRHTGDARRVVEASYEILDEAPKLLARAAEMREVMLTEEQRRAFALGAAALRFGFDKPEECPIDSTRLLDARRRQDEAPSLWNTFNVVQENVMKADRRIVVRKTEVGEDGRLHSTRSRMRKVKSIDGNMNLNRGLWVMAEALRQGAK